MFLSRSCKEGTCGAIAYKQGVSQKILPTVFGMLLVLGEFDRNIYLRFPMTDGFFADRSSAYCAVQVC